MDKFFNTLHTTFSYEAFLNTIINFLPNLIAALFILFAFHILWKLLNKFLNVLFKKISIDGTFQNFINNITKNILLLIGIITALSQVGINTGSMLASLGVAGLTIGFAAKDALSNIISGLFIFWDRPFVIGDLIEINNQYGKVEEITMRSTRLITVDGKMLSIPNSQILNSMVASYTNFPNLRIDIDFTVSSITNLNKLRMFLFELVQDNEIYLSKPEPEIVLNKINDYNIELLFRVWIKNEKEHVKIRFKLREKILDKLIENKIEMPYETINIVMDK